MSSPPESFLSTFNMPPSLPLIPHALTPSSSIMDTRLLLTLFKTISAISIVGSSVTRSPFKKCGSMPDFSTHLLISLPPPCTIIGLKPTSFNSTTSWMTFLFNSSSTIALPPYLTTIIFLLNFWIYGSASTRTCAFFNSSFISMSVLSIFNIHF